jgi:hypothetical protein
MAPINRLPTELVSWICTHLEPCDLFALRLASGDIAAKGFHHFAKRFFTSLHLLVTSDNLALLKDIADHPLLRACVREVWITPALFEGEYDLSIEDYSRGPGSNVAHIRDARYAAYQAAVADHLNIAMTPVLQRAFDDAFERFPNLKSVGLRHQFTDYLLACCGVNIGFPNAENAEGGKHCRKPQGGIRPCRGSRSEPSNPEIRPSEPVCGLPC